MATVPPFRSPVLEPSFDLCVSHLELFGECCSFCRGEVLLFVESLLEFTDLHACERSPWFFSFGGRSVLIGVPDPPRGDWGKTCGKRKRHCKGINIKQTAISIKNK
ncbi:hypothetical protein CDAR_565491 [Caerostris darwini]|uniref:Uncharacterized protein n=1 Tax=Caerostris darwini TaxID=1538125 RepID=A0AAV4TUN0_9ARAC|nr:hypothetical protein CDAR_565491 [Caerostris darwini]